MSTKAVELRIERQRIVEKMGDALRKNTPEGTAEWKQLDAHQEFLRLQIEDVESISRTSRPNFGPTLETNDRSEAYKRKEDLITSVAYRNAFHRWAKTGEVAEIRALGEGVALGGETLVPVGFAKEISRYMRAYGDWYDLARTVVTAQGNNLQWPVTYDTSSGSPQKGVWQTGNVLPENNENSEEEPGFTNVTLYADKLDSGLSRVSVELMQDSAFSMEALLSEIFGQRLGWTKDNGLILGNTGSGGQTTGLITQLTTAATSTVASGNKVLAVGANPNSGNSNDDEINSIGSGDLASLVQAVDPLYRSSPSCGFLANQATYDKLRAQLDKYGRPLWSSSIVEGSPDRIYGYPYRFSQNVALIGANNISMVFGDFSRYIIRDVLGISMVRFNELFMQYYQIGFQAYLRTFGVCLNPAAFSYLQHPLS